MYEINQKKKYKKNSELNVPLLVKLISKKPSGNIIADSGALIRIEYGRIKTIMLCTEFSFF